MTEDNFIDPIEDWVNKELAEDESMTYRLGKAVVSALAGVVASWLATMAYDAIGKRQGDQDLDTVEEIPQPTTED